MFKPAVVFCIIFFVFACKDKRASLSGNTPVDIKDFIEAFPTMVLPYRIADSNMIKVADTNTISYSVFKEFIPDSVLANTMGKNPGKTIINPVGKIEKESELYLLANFTQAKKTSMQTFLFDKENKYLSHLELLKQESKDGYVHSVSITNEPTFIISREKTNQRNELSYTRNGYAYNNGSGNFITVLNDSNEDLERINEIINPIDTFPRKNKFSADYADDKRNFISVRDGNTPNKYLFFIHFEKSNNCNGELKGEMILRDATHAYYQQSGDPCIIDFQFSNKSIDVKERGNCGNHRGIKCFFNDTYNKKKEPKQPISTRKK